MEIKSLVIEVFVIYFLYAPGPLFNMANFNPSIGK